MSADVVGRITPVSAGRVPRPRKVDRLKAVENAAETITNNIELVLDYMPELRGVSPELVGRWELIRDRVNQIVGQLKGRTKERHAVHGAQ